MLSVTQLPFPKDFGQQAKVKCTLKDDLWIPTEGEEGVKVPKGATVTLYQTTDFGWIVLDQPINGRKIFKW